MGNRITITPIGGEPWTVSTIFADECEWQKYAAKLDIPMWNSRGQLAAPTPYFAHMAWTAAQRSADIEVPDNFDVFLATVEAMNVDSAEAAGKASAKPGRKARSG